MLAWRRAAPVIGSDWQAAATAGRRTGMATGEAERETDGRINGRSWAATKEKNETSAGWVGPEGRQVGGGRGWLGYGIAYSISRVLNRVIYIYIYIYR